MDENIRNILSVENSSELGGANFSLLSLATGLCLNSRYRPTIVCPREGPMCDLCKEKHLSYMVIPGAKPSRVWPFPFWKRIESIKKLVRSIDARLIHANATSVYLSAGLVARQLEMPSVMHVRCLTSDEDFRWLFRHCPPPDAIVFISNYIREQCVGSLSSFVSDSCRLVTIYNPIDDDLSPDLKILARQEHEKQIVTKDTKIISMVGNFQPNKGHMTVIEAVKTLLRKGHDVRLLFAGKDVRGHEGFESQLKTICRKSIREDRIRFLGFRRDVRTVVLASDIAVCASQNEAFGRTCAEAMMLGKPVVATDHGGYVEQVLPGNTGFLVPLNNQSKMTEVLEKLILDTGLRNRMGQAGRVRAKLMFSTNNHVKHMEDLYDSLLD
ncbi:hypothetical protein DO021_21385 [Desulfobacter hydrogenophilus]|uniref:Glycosyltransferase family 1 protein n=1 Tax=Desulfobacter hydrogenophilus TaxID=2291 RepID=A0A328FA44_9BACT|nr:glycosyltransferase family 4 protein [Desulfobacter hydrogenophilus]NDY74432.1 glycosyltransferase family 4 protein [Desulfobacter hydrogenophilus]QBH13721.1 glycosyltransferase family 1 protein [Desulfobacter hydrogenophilus]RAM00005.1 hypothetical protein DO021_21385 [Desulfobacter hydrogenophilus]